MKENRLEIDMGRLHVEWARQPDVYHDAARDLAEKRAELDTLKAKMDVAGAECDREIREAPATFGISKITEASVEKGVILHPRYQAALKAVNKSKYDVGILQAMVDALDHKKKALEHLVQLHLADYFSDPRIPKSARGFDDAGKSEVRARAQRKVEHV